MRRAVVVLLGAAILLTSAELNACGDKFLRPGRSSRMRNYAAMYRASILLYPSAKASPAIVSAWEKMLKQAGHKSAVVKNGDLQETLAHGKYDLIISDYRDAARIADAFHALPVAPGIVPVLSNATKSVAEEVKKTYEHVIDADAMDRYQALAEIDHVMEVRIKGDNGQR
jgi:CheY-like chemotaxis protein